MAERACRTCVSWDRDTKTSARDSVEHPDDRPCIMPTQPGLVGRAEVRGRKRTVWTAPTAHCTLWLTPKERR